MRLVRPGLSETPAVAETRERREQLERLEPVDSKEFPGVRDRLEQREVRVQLVQLEIQDLQVIGVALAIPGPVD